MSYAIVSVVYGVPLTQEISRKIQAMEEDESSSWFEDDEGTCGFRTLYSASGRDLVGYCGVELTELSSYVPSLLSSIPAPTPAQIAAARTKIERLLPELKALVPEPDVYFIWSDS